MTKREAALIRAAMKFCRLLEHKVGKPFGSGPLMEAYAALAKERKK